MHNNEDKLKMLNVHEQQEQQPPQRRPYKQQQQQRQQRQHRQRTQQKYIDIFVFLILTATICIQFVSGAELVINIPEDRANSDAFYRIDYTPPFGYPEPNTTIPAREIGKELKLSRALPGTKYNFWLYYTNFTHHDLLTWKVAITTVPEPPANLSIHVRSTKNAIISWSPPTQGSYSGFKINVIGLTDATGFSRTYYENHTVQHAVKELTSGATYHVQAYTIFDGKESAAYTSRNFTTKPNMPGKFIVWFRNETTMLVLWQPPLLGGLYTHYKVSIAPPDALQSVFYVERDDEPGPAQAAFKGLVPGRPYNISVQTMSENVSSEPTTARYLTMPIRPTNVTFDADKITTNSFRVRWEVPRSFSEYDSFQVSLVTSRRAVFTVPRTNATTAFFDYHETLEPGKTYGVVVKTMSDNVNSWPATGEVTLRPLPVRQLRAFPDDYKNIIHVSWEPDETSTQKEYRIIYYDLEHIDPHGIRPQIINTHQTEYKLEYLLAGRHYQISVQAVSKNMTSNASTIVMDTRPAAPVIVELRGMPMGLNISWKSDVNSKQDRYEVRYSRNGTSEVRTIVTNQTQMVIKNLLPGAGYDVKVYAVSHNLRSDTHSYFQAVSPKPPRNLTIETLDSSSIQLRWLPPDGGEFSEYSVRFRTKSEQWQRLPNVHDNKVTIKDLRRGERYIVQLNTVSHGVESLSPLEVNTTMSPQPVTNVVTLVDSRNLTLEWPTLDDRVDYYTLKWWATDAPNEQMYKNVTEHEIIAAPFVHVAIDGLIPGTQYNFEIQSHSYGYNSGITLLSTSTMPLIQSDVFVADCETPEELHNLMISYTPTPSKSTKFDIYRFSLGDPMLKDKEKLANDTERKVIFNDLVPGRLYNISVWTLSNGVASLPIQRQERLPPEPVTELLATAIGERRVTLHWQLPAGDFTDFEVQYLSEDDVLLQNTTAENELILNDLWPFHNYTFTVLVRSGNESTVLRSSAPVSISVTTKQAPPGRVDYFIPIDVRPREITFKWYLPQREANGVIQSFTVSYANKQNANDTGIIEIDSGETLSIIRDLEPGADYTFAIQAKSTLGYGPEREFAQTMPILAPPCTDPTITPAEVTHTSSTIQIRFGKNYFSDDNGRVRKYSVIVAEDVTKNASGLEIPSWQDVQSYSVWLPYQAAESYQPFANDINVVNFTIGGEKCNAASAGFCNGPLKSGTTYRIKVRAFTDDDKFTDTVYSASIRTDSNITVIVVIATLTLMLALIGGLAYLHRRYRSSPKRPKRPRLCTAFPMPSSNSTTSRPVHVKNFIEYCRVMSADSDIRFSEEFDELKHVGRYQSCTFADLPCNRPKNRFTNILPYDHSRFKLQPADDEEGSDYINANYVPGYNSPREFIVTQGPLPSTCEDFWRMCWESSSRVIIMLTRCVEKGREKCHQYWPGDRNSSCYYGDIRVRVISASYYNDWVVTRIMLYKGTDQRLILHFHFITWPDFGVPDPPATLVRFVQAFRATIGVEARPIIVHCSAGVGRSGTFIALDHIMHQTRSSEYVDIFGVVYNMRKERVQMVQTEQQYICIHECLILWLYDGLQEKPLPQPLDTQHRQTPSEDETETETDGEEAAVIKRNSTNVAAATATVAAADANDDDDADEDDDDDSEDTTKSIEDEPILMMMKVL